MAEKYNVKEVLFNFSQNTTAHGWSRMASARNWFLRLVWLALLAGSWIMIGIQVRNLYNKYSSHPVSTKVTLVNTALDFPAVTICNHNSVQFSKIITEQPIKNFLLSIENYFFGSFEENISNFPSTTESPNVTTPPANQDVDYWWNEVMNGTFDFNFDSNIYFNPDKFQGIDPLFKADEEFKLRLAAYPFDYLKTFDVDPHVFIVKCTFGGRECNASDFEETRDYNYGMCYTFPNSKKESKPRKSRVAGPNNGLQLILNIQQSDYVPYVAPTAGVRVAIHDLKTRAYPYETGFSIPPGMETSVSLNMEKIQRLGRPYGDCSSTNQHSSLVNCINECIQSTIKRNCSCSKLLDALFQICKSNEDIACVSDVLTSLQNPDSPCSKCTKPCNETVYTKVISNSLWPSDVYEEALRREVNNIAYSWEGIQGNLILSSEESRKNLLKLNIFYGELYVQTIKEEQAYLIDQFASDVGGQLGLWAGISILSITECVELFLTLCQIIAYRLKHGARKTTSKDTNKPSTSPEKSPFQITSLVKLEEMP